MLPNDNVLISDSYNNCLQCGAGAIAAWCCARTQLSYYITWARHIMEMKTSSSQLPIDDAWIILYLSWGSDTSVFISYINIGHVSHSRYMSNDICSNRHLSLLLFSTEIFKIIDTLKIVENVLIICRLLPNSTVAQNNNSIANSQGCTSATTIRYWYDNLD